MTKPDFFIVGAPKCGTTALCKYLNKHPKIFIPEIKELHYFGADLNGKKYAKSLAEYLVFFQEGQNCLCGEGTVWYLFSKHAAQEIYDFNPNAKIIIMLREPVALLYALHSQHLFNGSSEDIQDFQQALDAEAQRKLGKRIPPKCQAPEILFYREVVKFTEQVQRYLDTFGSAQVKVIIFDDFQADTAKVYRETLEFLRVEPDFQTEFVKMNTNKRVRSVAIQQIIKYPPSRILEIGKFFVPLPRSARRYLLESFKETIKRFNTQKVPRPPLSPELRRSLQQEFAPEIKRLSALLGRDLTYWSEDASTSGLR